MRRIVLLLMAVVSGSPMAATINRDCQPSGLINMAKEKFSPASFWTAALNEIDVTLKGEQDAFRLMQLENRNDKIRANLEDSELRAMGIPPDNDPQLARELAESEREMMKMERDMLLEVQQWAAKCRAYANHQLSK